MITKTFFTTLAITILLTLKDDVQCFTNNVRHSSSIMGFSINTNSQSRKQPSSSSYPNISTYRSIGSRPPNIPPSLPPGGGNDNDFEGLISTALTIAGVALFFSSPLGGIFFAIFNSLFVLALLVPLVAVIGFQAWTAFNTIQGPCPNCGSNVVVIKDSDGNDNPSLCINCGVTVRSTQDKKGIELCNTPGDDFFGVGDNNGFAGGLFDIFGSGSDNISDNSPSGGSLFDIFGNDSDVSDNSPSVRKGVSLEDKATKRKRETTIIDVDVSDD